MLLYCLKYKKKIESKTRTSQKIKFFIKDFSSKCDQICTKMRIWSQLLGKSSMKSFIFGGSTKVSKDNKTEVSKCVVCGSKK